MTDEPMEAETPCPDCEDGRREYKDCGHYGCACPCSTVMRACETCKGTGLVTTDPAKEVSNAH